MTVGIVILIILFHMGSIVIVALTASKERADDTSRDVDSDIAIDRAQTASTVCSKVVLLFSASQIKFHLAHLVSVIAAVEEVVDDQFATIAAGFQVLDDFDAGAQTVGTTEAEADMTAFDLAIGLMYLTVNAHIGFRNDTIAATKDVIETATIHNGVRAYGMSGIAASKDLLDGVFAAVDIDMGHFLRVFVIVFRCITGFVAATKHLVDGIRTIRACVVIHV